jgi:acyl carrier protein
LAGIWGALLALEEVAADRTFVDLGGDSLKAIRAVGEIFKEFEVEVSLRVFFEEGTVRKLAAWLESETGSR